MSDGNDVTSDKVNFRPDFTQVVYIMTEGRLNKIPDFKDIIPSKFDLLRA